MPLKFYQIIVLVVSIVMLMQGVWRLKTNINSQSLLKISARIVVWCGMIVIALYPSLTDTLAHFIGMEGNINAVILIGFLLIFSIIFRILSIIERIEKNITLIARKDAIDNSNKK